jgi:hypothetical protein
MALFDTCWVILQTENLANGLLLLMAVFLRRHLGRRLLDTLDERGITLLCVLHHRAERELSRMVNWIEAWMAEAFGESEAELLHLASAEGVVPRAICGIHAIQSRGSVCPYLNRDLCRPESSERLDDLLDLSLLRGGEDVSHFGLHDIEPRIIEVIRAEDENLGT